MYIEIKLIFSTSLKICFQYLFLTSLLDSFLLIVCMFFWIFLCTQLRHLQVVTILFIYFLILMPFCLFCFALLHKLGPLIINRSDDGILISFPISFKGETFTISSLNMMFAAVFFFVDNLYQIEEVLLFFISSGYWILSDAFFFSLKPGVLFVVVSLLC